MKSSIIALSLSMALALTACASGPDDTATRFVDAAYAGKTAEAMERMDPSIAQVGGPKLIAMIGKVSKDAARDGGLKDAKAIETKVEGDYATVRIEETFGNGSKKTENMKMRKVDGKWYVTM